MELRTKSPHSIVGTLDRLGLSIFTIGAGAVIAWCIWMLAVTVRSLLGLVPQGGESFITRTIREGFPPLFDEATGAVIIIGTKGPWFASENPSSTFVQLYLWATVASTFTVLAIALMVLLLCIRLLLGKPFTRTVTWLIGVAGLTLIVGGLISQLLHALSRQSMVDGLRYLAAPNHITVPYLPFSLDVGPIAAGIVLAVIAAAFKFGERLQRDTEGLV